MHTAQVFSVFRGMALTAYLGNGGSRSVELRNIMTAVAIHTYRRITIPICHNFCMSAVGCCCKLIGMTLLTRGVHIQDHPALILVGARKNHLTWSRSISAHLPMTDCAVSIISRIGVRVSCLSYMTYRAGKIIMNRLAWIKNNGIRTSIRVLNSKR